MLSIPGNLLTVPQSTTVASTFIPTNTANTSNTDAPVFANQVLLIALVVSIAISVLLVALAVCLWIRKKRQRLQVKFQSSMVEIHPAIQPNNQELQPLSPVDTLQEFRSNNFEFPPRFKERVEINQSDFQSSKQDTDFDVLRSKINLSVSDFSRQLIETPSTVMQLPAFALNALQDLEIKNPDERIQSKLIELQPPVIALAEKDETPVSAQRNSEIIMPPRLSTAERKNL
ncbi:hypothetical protein HDV06_004829 [Boothiomyces sp. JEL0866]|nr:hypothetical protein HDV06_004829 [Boothiomyces sp. JEL0866]